MALNVPNGEASYNQSGTEYLDLSPVMTAVLLADTFFLGAIGAGEEGTQRTKYWNKDALNATTVVQASGTALDLAGTVTTVTVSVADAAFIALGALIKDIAANSEEVLQVTAINTGSGALTVTRAYGATATPLELHSATATFRIISQPKQENDKTVKDRSKLRTQEYNRFQIFKTEAEVSATMRAIEHAGIPDEFNYQIAQRTLEIRRELGMAVYHSIKSAEGADGVYRTMSGVREFVVVGGNVRSVQESLDENVVNTLQRLRYAKGGDEGGECWGAAEQITRFAQLFEDKVRLQPSDKMRGQFVNVFMTDMGQELPLRIDRWISTSELLIAPMDYVKLHWLKNRGWHMEPLGKTGDGDMALIVGECTISVRNAAERFALHNRLNVA